MTGMTIADLAKKMKGIDIAMVSSISDGGAIAARPMSNNGDVEYDGDSWFFGTDSSRLASDIRADPQVSLAFQGSKSLLGAPGIAVAVQGTAELIHDRAALEEHWTKDVERYYADGIDTPGIVLIKVHATRIHYWDGEENGEVRA